MTSLESIERLRDSLVGYQAVTGEDMGAFLLHADEIEREIAEKFVELPEGWAGEQAADVLAYWPTWDDGSPCMFGDEFTCYPKYDFEKKYETLDRLSIFGPNHVWDRGREGETPHSGGYYEWNFTRPGGDGCEEYRPTKRKPRTVEDVLADFRFEANLIYDDQHIGGEDRADKLHELDVKYAAEIRGMMEVRDD